MKNLVDLDVVSFCPALLEITVVSGKSSGATNAISSGRGENFSGLYAAYI